MIVRDVIKRKDKNKLISNQLKLIEGFKKNKQKVILVGGDKNGKPSKKIDSVMFKLWGNEESKNPAENKVIPELLNSNYYYYVDKSRYSAFFKTDLEEYCKKNEINELYFCGISSGVCVYFSAADAVMRGIQPYLVTDASGSVSDKQHKININNFESVIGPSLTTKDVLKKIK